MTQGQALNLVFSSGTVIERKNLYLNDEQKKNIELRAKSKLDFGLVTYYVGTNADGGTNGFVFFNSHRVRTMPETMMACVNPDGSLRLVEILAFYEPADYLPPKKWFELFPNKKLNEDLWVKRGIRNVTGATLTTQAITENVRRILAIFEVAIKPELKEKK
ncbi:MAG: FMN-binding protein [Elusimicrobiota bacterium]